MLGISNMKKDQLLLIANLISKVQIKKQFSINLPKENWITQ